MNLALFKEKYLSKKNIILILIIILLIIIAIILYLILRKNETQKKETFSTFYSNDSSISILLSDKYKFSKSENESYKLILDSVSLDSNIYFSEVNMGNIRDEKKFIEGDKNDYISKFSNINNVSDITETTIGEKKAYNYNFNYRQNMYVDVYWIIDNNKFLIIDFNINTDKLDKNVIEDVLNNITFN